jgi:hypothetical protein
MSDAFPLDFAGLQKDQDIPQAHIEAIYQIKHEDDPDRYRLNMMRLCEEIRKHRDDLCVRCKNLTVRIMTDREAEHWTVDRHAKHIRGIAKNLSKRAAIDRDEFNDGEKRAAEHWDNVISTSALQARRAMLKARRETNLMLRPKSDE